MRYEILLDIGIHWYLEMDIGNIYPGKLYISHGRLKNELFADKVPGNS